MKCLQGTSKSACSYQWQPCSQIDSLPVRASSPIDCPFEIEIQNPDQAQRTQIPRRLTVPAQGAVEEVDAVIVGREAGALEDLDDEMVIVERVEAGAAVLLLVADTMTVM